MKTRDMSTTLGIDSCGWRGGWTTRPPATADQPLHKSYPPPSESWLREARRLGEFAYTEGQREDSLPALQKRVAHILSTESEDGPWSARDGMCLDLAAKWHQRLKRDGIKSHIVAVDPSLAGQTLPLNGKKVHGKFHAYLVLGKGKEQLLLDGSIRQFFAGPEERDDLPQVFVGRSQELKSLFSKHRRDLRLEVVGDPNQGHYPPEELANFAYGLGPFEASREILN